MTKDVLTDLLNLSSPAIAIAFTDAPPVGIQRVASGAPAHKPCPIGAHTHHVVTNAPFLPDVVLVRGNARQLMLLTEAAELAGVAGVGSTMGPPTCAVLPASINTETVPASFGCVGNRVYTGATDNEAYIAIPAAHLGSVGESLRTILKANDALEQFHPERASRES